MYRINQLYLSTVQPTPPTDIEEHLKRLADEYNKKPKLHYEKLMKNLTKYRLKKYYAYVKTMRKGILCSICNYKNNRYINVGDKEITYSKKFCLAFTGLFVDVLANKYVELAHQLVLLDEWSYLITNKHLFGKLGDLNMIKRIILIVRGC